MKSSSSEFGDVFDAAALDAAAALEAAAIAQQAARKPSKFRPALPKRVWAPAVPVRTGSASGAGRGSVMHATAGGAGAAPRPPAAKKVLAPLARHDSKKENPTSGTAGLGKGNARAEASDEALWGDGADDDAFQLVDLDSGLTDSQLLRGAIVVERRAHEELVILDSEDDTGPFVDTLPDLAPSQARVRSSQAKFDLVPPRASQNRMPPPPPSEEGDLEVFKAPRRTALQTAPRRFLSARRLPPSPLPPSSPPPEIIPDSDDELFGELCLTVSQIDALESGAVAPKLAPPRAPTQVIEIDDDEEDSILMPPPPKKKLARPPAPVAQFRPRPQHHRVPDSQSSDTPLPVPRTELNEITLEDSPVLPARRRRAAVVDSSSPNALPAPRAGPSRTHLDQPAADGDSSVEILPKAFSRLRRGRANSLPGDEEPSSDDAPIVPAKRKKKAKLTEKQAQRSKLFDLEAVNSSASEAEPSSEAYSAADSDDRAFVASQEEDVSVDSPAQRRFYLESLQSQAPPGFQTYLPGAYRMSRGVGRYAAGPVTPRSQDDDLSYSYDSFCVPDDDEEVEPEATSSQ